MQYLLVAVNCFSRKCSVKPLTDETGQQVKVALQKVFEDLCELEKIQCNKGKEFYNNTVKDFLQGLNVTLLSAKNSDIKFTLAERFIRTLKDRMFRMFRYRVSTRYIDKLNDLVYSCNNSAHSSH